MEQLTKQQIAEVLSLQMSNVSFNTSDKTDLNEQLDLLSSRLTEVISLNAQPKLALAILAGETSIDSLKEEIAAHIQHGLKTGVKVTEIDLVSCDYTTVGGRFELNYSLENAKLTPTIREYLNLKPF